MSRRLAAETPDDPAPSTDWRVLRTLWPYLTEFPVRVAVAMASLCASWSIWRTIRTC